jgi:hypothetical protein
MPWKPPGRWPVVRDPQGHTYAREESDFDYCTALPDPNGTGPSCA